MRHVIVCPGCGDPHTTIDLSDAPRAKRLAKRLRGERFAALRAQKERDAGQRARARVLELREEASKRLGSLTPDDVRQLDRDLRAARRVDPREVEVTPDEIAPVTEQDLEPELAVCRRRYAELCALPGSDVYTCTACGASVKLDPDLSKPCGFAERDVTVPIPTRLLRHPRTGELRVVGRHMKGARVSFRVSEVDPEREGAMRERVLEVGAKYDLGTRRDVHVRVENANGWREVLLPIEEAGEPSVGGD